MPETKTRKIKYFTKEILILANKQAIRTNRNRTLEPKALKKLPNLCFPVGFTMIHNDCEMRVEITVGPDADHLQSVWLDIPFDVYNNLPEAEVPA